MGQACGAVRNLALNSSDNQARLGACGGCEAVVEALRAHGTSNADVAQWVRGAGREAGQGAVD